MRNLADTLAPDQVVAELRGRRDTEARAIVRAYAKRAKPSDKRCPPGFEVVSGYAGSGGIEAMAVGPTWRGGVFEYTSVSDFAGNDARRVVSEGAWAYYAEVWDDAHAALDRAGAFTKDQVAELRGHEVSKGYGGWCVERKVGEAGRLTIAIRGTRRTAQLLAAVLEGDANAVRLYVDATLRGAPKMVQRPHVRRLEWARQNACMLIPPFRMPEEIAARVLAELAKR
jgi:hypothetical protein